MRMGGIVPSSSFEAPAGRSPPGDTHFSLPEIP